MTGYSHAYGGGGLGGGLVRSIIHGFGWTVGRRLVYGLPMGLVVTVAVVAVVLYGLARVGRPRRRRGVRR